jgi:hypothetical protein
MPVSMVHAIDEDEVVNLGDFPQKLADALNVSLFVGQLLASLIFMAIFLLPSMLIAGYWGGAGAVLYTVIIVGLASSGVCVALAWFPVWLYAIMCLLIAVMFATKFTGLVGGGKEES